MNSKLNEKINQVTNTTLVVGMDIAKRKHYATFVDDRGRQLVKAFPVHQSKAGFDFLYDRLVSAMKEFGKNDVVVGIEPTGHYWLNLFHFLNDHGIPLVMTNPMHVKRSKELDELTLELTAIIQVTPEYEYLSTVPGLGEATIIDLLSEIGSFSHYRDPRQLVKLVGLTLRENSSGMHKGQKRISKRGRRKLRALLFRVVMPIIRHNEAFKKLHEYYTTRTHNPPAEKAIHRGVMREVTESAPHALHETDPF